MKIDIVCDHKIDKAIAVVVAKRRAGGPTAIGDSSFGRDVGKGAIAIIAVEDVAPETCNVYIGPAIIVIITDRSAHGEAGSRHSGFSGDIGEGAVMIVVVERSLALLTLHRHLHRGRVGEKDNNKAETK